MSRRREVAAIGERDPHVVYLDRAVLDDDHDLPEGPLARAHRDHVAIVGAVDTTFAEPLPVVLDADRVLAALLGRNRVLTALLARLGGPVGAGHTGCHRQEQDNRSDPHDCLSLRELAPGCLPERWGRSRPTAILGWVKRLWRPGVPVLELALATLVVLHDGPESVLVGERVVDAEDDQAADGGGEQRPVVSPGQL